MEARFCAPVQTGPGAYSASITMGTGSLPEVKRPGRGVYHLTLFGAEVKERVELYLYSPSGLQPLVRNSGYCGVLLYPGSRGRR